LHHRPSKQRARRHLSRRRRHRRSRTRVGHLATGAGIAHRRMARQLRYCPWRDARRTRFQHPQKMNHGKSTTEKPMRAKLFLMTTAFTAILLVAATVTQAQPGGKKGDKGGGETLDEFVAKLMAFNKAKDGKLTKTELTDPRLHDLFDRA